MSLLRKIISTIRSDHAQQAIEESTPANVCDKLPHG
jgi:hypothetical protein